MIKKEVIEYVVYACVFITMLSQCSQCATNKKIHNKLDNIEQKIDDKITNKTIQDTVIVTALKGCEETNLVLEKSNEECSVLIEKYSVIVKDLKDNINRLENDNKQLHKKNQILEKNQK